MAAKVEREGGTPVTRDLLGGSKVLGRNLMTKNMFYGPATSTPEQSHRPLEDLNCPPLNFSVFKPPSPPNLELKLFPLYTSENHSVCTLDKVKSALERARRSSKRFDHKPPKLYDSTSPTSTSTTTKVGSEEESESRSSVEDESLVKPAFVAAGCPGCLSYVLVSDANPSCPRCLTVVPSPVLKKARIQLDLNSTST